jgi:transcriptional adapter 2-alpha
MSNKNSGQLVYRQNINTHVHHSNLLGQTIQSQNQIISSPSMETLHYLQPTDDNDFINYTQINSQSTNPHQRYAIMQNVPASNSDNHNAIGLPSSSSTNTNQNTVAALLYQKENFKYNLYPSHSNNNAFTHSTTSSSYYANRSNNPIFFSNQPNSTNNQNISSNVISHQLNPYQLNVNERSLTQPNNNEQVLSIPVSSNLNRFAQQSSSHPYGFSSPIYSLHPQEIQTNNSNNNNNNTNNNNDVTNINSEISMNNHDNNHADINNNKTIRSRLSNEQKNNIWLDRGIMNSTNSSVPDHLQLGNDGNLKIYIHSFLLIQIHICN